MTRSSLARPLFGLVLLAASFLTVPVHAAPAPAWSIDEAHSSISFTIRHILANVTGTFDKFSGTILFDPDNLAGSRVEIEIPISSINTRNTRRDEHLQTADFFDAAKFPVMRFVGDTFVRNKGNSYSLVGRLTIRDVTRKVVLPFVYQGAVDHPMKPGTLVTGTRVELGILRSEYGVGSGNFAATAVIGDEVAITLDIEATRKKEDAKPAASQPAK